jgi:deazaflavin-dependent oxidoreductase (nitroreductase family)
VSEQGSSVPAPPGWREEHRRRYEATNGEDGYLWNGVPTLLLTTTGRKTGNKYTTPLIFGRDGERYLIVGSVGGRAKHAQWYLNLRANPEIEVQVKAEKFNANARTATPDEKPALWKTMTAIWPAYDDYQQKTTREIPVVIIERA